MITPLIETSRAVFLSRNNRTILRIPSVFVFWYYSNDCTDLFKNKTFENVQSLNNDNKYILLRISLIYNLLFSTINVEILHEYKWKFISDEL